VFLLPFVSAVEAKLTIGGTGLSTEEKASHSPSFLKQSKKWRYKKWQGVLSNRWIDMLFNSTSVRNNEPWFNNNMRKFIISFLEKYESLNDSEKENLKNRIKSLIKDE
jgi:hypothetical protein